MTASNKPVIKLNLVQERELGWWFIEFEGALRCSKLPQKPTALGVDDLDDAEEERQFLLKALRATAPFASWRKGRVIDCNADDARTLEEPRT